MFLFQMMIAQTGLTSSSNPGSQPGSNPIGDRPTGDWLWWLLPVALGALLASLLIRMMRIRPEQKLSTKDLNGSKAAAGKSRRASSEQNNDASSEGNRDRVAGKSSGSKKKKKNRSNSDRVFEAPVSTNAPAEKASTKSKKERLREQELSYAQPIVPNSPSPTAVNAPVTPIFEPLRDVGALRRSVSQAKQSTTTEPKSADKSPEAQLSVSKLSSGKFERIVSSTTTSQSAANRWPIPVTQSTNTKSVASSVPQAAESQSEESAEKLKKTSDKSKVALNIASSDTTPNQGLKSFVSKVKSITTTSAAPDTAD